VRKTTLSARRSSLGRLIAITALALASAPGLSAAQDSHQRPLLRTPSKGAGNPLMGGSRPQPGGSFAQKPASPTAPAAPGGAPGATPPGAPALPRVGLPGATPRDGAAVPGAPNPGDTGDDPISKLSTPSEFEFKPKPGNYEVSFDLRDVDLPTLVEAVSKTTGKKFIFGSKLRAIQATVVSPGKVSMDEAYAAFLAILEQNGMTVIPHGSYLKIVESQDASNLATPIYGTASPVPAEDRYITRLYRLQNISTGEVVAILDKFKTKDALIVPYEPSNLLIITETGTNTRRLMRIIEEIDVGSAGDQLWVQPVHNAAASEVATKLSEILGGGSGGTGRGAQSSSNIIADDRTNSLILKTTKTDYEKILDLIRKLDTPLTGDSQIHVLPLQHAKCADLQTTLTGVLGSGGGAARPAGGNARRPGAAGQGATGGGAPGTTDEIFEGQVKVNCDEATNALVTTSSLRDFVALRNVIDQLDRPRRQVFIEAVIMDLNIDRSTDFGLGYHGGAPIGSGDTQSFFYGGNNPGASIAGVPANLEALALGVRGPEIEGSQNLFGTGVSIPALGVVMHALAKDSDSNVLATPHILATDSVQAEISIGQNIALQTNLGNVGQLAQAAGAGGAGLQGFFGGLGGLGGQGQRQDIGTRITVTPYINDSDQVRLELAEEISDLGARDGALGAASINKRTAKTTLIVKDQQTIVIGGLVRDQFSVGESKVPLLGDIPVLGFLFRQQTKKKTKTNLLLVLTPHVVRDQADLRRIFERKMQERQEFLDRYFVFNDGAEWEPPQDWTRANGLLETIRQAQMTLAERERLEAEVRPRAKTHEPVEPISLPSIGDGGGGSAAPAARPAGGAATPAARPSTQRGTVRRPGGARTPAPTNVEQ